MHTDTWTLRMREPYITSVQVATVQDTLGLVSASCKQAALTTRVQGLSGVGKRPVGAHSRSKGGSCWVVWVARGCMGHCNDQAKPAGSSKIQLPCDRCRLWHETPVQAQNWQDDDMAVHTCVRSSTWSSPTPAHSTEVLEPMPRT